jgi:hypothetical protein
MIGRISTDDGHECPDMSVVCFPEGDYTQGVFRRDNGLIPIITLAHKLYP